ncbi:signal peptidase II [Nitratireductor pacificus]|uniref:Lipoprotein signal peptidase n=1 Tax=Nitratireductor pacificus pht-3B TaxID=391937 RepID=K2MCZ6_9HYPH|nr:signal peptidase II [Nitratireductor pacificus]EKF20071.1 lipoprotein signal peptidase [Nitratireductor pacificus pht-3B]
MNPRAIALYGLLTLAFALADQLVKELVETTLPLHEKIDVLPFLALLHARNTGIAFSMFSGMSGTGLSIVMAGVIVFIGYLAMRTGAAQHWARLGFALILGGAFGNLIDRLTNGYVTDYIYFHTPVWSFAIFNLADAFITVGAGLVILDELLDWRRARAARGKQTD